MCLPGRRRCVGGMVRLQMPVCRTLLWAATDDRLVSHGEGAVDPLRYQGHRRDAGVQCGHRRLDGSVAATAPMCCLGACIKHQVQGLPFFCYIQNAIVALAAADFVYDPSRSADIGQHMRIQMLDLADCR